MNCFKKFTQIKKFRQMNSITYHIIYFIVCLNFSNLFPNIDKLFQKSTEPDSKDY